MSTRYKFDNPTGVYFISFATVGWTDVFTRMAYKDIFVESLRHCQQHKGLELYAWCLMTNHVHLVAKANGTPSMSDILRDLKKFTSKQIVRAIEENPHESRRENGCSPCSAMRAASTATTRTISSGGRTTTPSNSTRPM